MHLIIGPHTLSDAKLRPIPGGYQAQLAGAGLRRLLDATFSGASITVLGGDLRAQGLDVTDIRMGGATTIVTLMSRGQHPLH